jgi:hypothetical protein
MRDLFVNFLDKLILGGQAAPLMDLITDADMKNPVCFQEIVLKAVFCGEILKKIGKNAQLVLFLKQSFPNSIHKCNLESRGEWGDRRQSKSRS